MREVVVIVYRVFLIDWHLDKPHKEYWPALILICGWKANVYRGNMRHACEFLAARDCQSVNVVLLRLSLSLTVNMIYMVSVMLSKNQTQEKIGCVNKGLHVVCLVNGKCRWLMLDTNVPKGISGEKLHYKLPWGSRFRGLLVPSCVIVQYSITEPKYNFWLWVKETISIYLFSDVKFVLLDIDVAGLCKKRPPTRTSQWGLFQCIQQFGPEKHVSRHSTNKITYYNQYIPP